MIQALWPSVKQVLSLQPQLDEMERAKGPAGWTQVQSWCQQNAQSLDDVLEPDIGDPIDLLVVAVDIDIAIAAGITDPPQEVGDYESSRLRRTIEGWLKAGRRKLPPALVISTPVMAIEAWVIAALFPRERAPERIAGGAQWLVEKKKLRLSPTDGTPWKELYRYRDFAARVANNLHRVRKACAEAERTSQSIENRRDQVADCPGRRLGRQSQSPVGALTWRYPHASQHAHANEPSPIPSAPFDDLDLDRPEDEEEWERRVMALAAARIVAARAARTAGRYRRRRRPRFDRAAAGYAARFGHDARDRLTSDCTPVHDRGRRSSGQRQDELLPP